MLNGWQFWGKDLIITGKLFDFRQQDTQAFRAVKI